MRDASVSGRHPVSRRATFAQSDIHSCKPPIEQERPRPNQGRLTRCRIHPYTPGMRSLRTVVDLEDGPRGQTSLALASSCIGNESVPIQLAQCWFPGLAISSAKMYIYFHFSIQFYQTALEKLLWFEISKILIVV